MIIYVNLRPDTKILLQQDLQNLLKTGFINGLHFLTGIKTSSFKSQQSDNLRVFKDNPNVSFYKVNKSDDDKPTNKELLANGE